ncbi:MAG: hypothetical protein H7Z19_13040 [Chitinophagaceae bacterium]|nr:hypothetical protein [Rubrivivax sp.]
MVGLDDDDHDGAITITELRLACERSTFAAEGGFAGGIKRAGNASVSQASRAFRPRRPPFPQRRSRRLRASSFTSQEFP